MSEFRIGSACTGYAGLDLVVQAVFGGEHAWMAENDPHASTVLAHHYPAVPNLGDITTLDWAGVEPVDILVAGFPCKDISKAHRAGQGDGIHGKRSGVWKNVAEGVRALRPGLVVLENVTAIRTRGLDVVAADLAAVGYDAVWTCLRASDVGAPHKRDRWFALAFPRDVVPSVLLGLHGPGSGHGRVTPAAVGVLLPTPTARDWKSAASNLVGTNSRPLPEVLVNRPLDANWVDPLGTDYGPAVRRWESVLSRPAPAPVEPGTKGNIRISPLFSEWMMGLPPGHVTAVPGVPRKHQLRVLGEGVVPLQGVAAIRTLISILADVLGLEAVA